MGYVFAKIDRENRMLEKPGQLDLVYTISEGDQYRVGRIDVEIKGESPHTQILTVLNRLSFKPGDLVDIRKLRDSERRLKASQLFVVDPQKGSVPKIVYNPPDGEKDKELIADGPRRQTSNYRPPADGPAAPLPPGQRYANLVLHYNNWADFEHDQQASGQYPAQPAGQNVPQYGPQPVPQYPLQPVPQPAPPPQYVPPPAPQYIPQPTHRGPHRL